MAAGKKKGGIEAHKVMLSFLHLLFILGAKTPSPANKEVKYYTPLSSRRAVPVTAASRTGDWETLGQDGK
jgi:hypothetical protein